jgi:hypothetical protein
VATDHPLADTQNRTVKLAMDTGEASSPEEAEAIFGRYRLVVHLGPAVALSPTLQAAALTAVNAGVRCFLGGVTVTGAVDVPLRVTWPGTATLREALTALGACDPWAIAPGDPHLLIGEPATPLTTSGFAIRATFDGWRGGIVPADGVALADREEFPPAGVLAGALGVAETLWYYRGDRADAGRRSTGLSLWRPGASGDWWKAENGPQLRDLPARLWLIGLGHLGQAYLWTLGLLPYAEPGAVELVLQDIDTLVEANWSTGLLTFPSMLGQRKTRAMSAWAEARGFRTRLIERRFAANFSLVPGDPQLALCGVDQRDARAALEHPGFTRMIDAGLGRANEFDAIQLHGFPASRGSNACWPSTAEDVSSSAERLLTKPAYRALAVKGEIPGLSAVDFRCGLTQLADRAVAAAFVGAVASALVVSEAIRVVMGELPHELIDLSLRYLEHRVVVPNSLDLPPINLGFARAAHES